ncbi:subtype B tannase [Moraxella oblonga]|uniref:subtype B tannase n=1 Tax=Moraxella oblonga TaxID=200413 RepID=UPI0009FF6516|nr:subtype B tannase [Moraxella oblonga]
MKKRLLSTALLMTLTACQIPAVSNDDNQTKTMKQNTIPEHLDFSKLTGEKRSFELGGQTIFYRAYENIVYVANPVDKAYQTMNIYIPEGYFNNQTINDFNQDTAPIFFPNGVGGYMPAKAQKVEINKRNNQSNSLMVALSKGFVVASAGARGRTLKNETGDYIGKAPSAIVDLKAAVRYLKANDKAMMGDANKIISNGTSAGGALSALLGASGNSSDYEAYLNELGALKASDKIFAVSAYSPITNLENADMAYEWQFNGVNDYQKVSIQMLDYNVERKLIKGTQTKEQIQLSDKLKPLFANYVNGLNLKNHHGELLSLDKNGNGTFKTHLEHLLIKSAQTALDNGTDLSKQTWLKIQNNKVVSVNFDDYAKFIGRQKVTPAFDGVDLSTGENNLFGNAHTDNQHFTLFSMTHNTAPNATRVSDNSVKMMNAMNYVSKDTGAIHYRIRHGQNDKDTSLAIPALLALKLQNTQGKTVDFAVPFGQGHSGDYDLEELFAWAKEISIESKQANK